MKSKFFHVVLVSLFAAGAMAQDCTFFFPQTKGSQLVRKGYDAKGNLQNVMTYIVDEVENTANGMEVEADYVYTDASGNVISKGDLDASCQDGEFFIEMKDLVSFPNAISMANADVDITSDFMNYPDAFAGDFGDGSDQSFDDVNINIYQKKNKKNKANVSIYDREYVKTEDVMTPAGTFSCAKVKFNMDVRTPNNKYTGYGYEWYAPNVGIVRTEQFDKNGVLQSYSVLEEVK